MSGGRDKGVSSKTALNIQILSALRRRLDKRAEADQMTKTLIVEKALFLYLNMRDREDADTLSGKVREVNLGLVQGT